MKLQLSLVVAIAVLLAYIYHTRDEQDVGVQLLGLSTYQRKVADAKNKWKQLHGKTKEPATVNLLKWVDKYYKYRELHNRIPSTKLDLTQWAIDLKYWYEKFGEGKRFETRFNLIAWAAGDRTKQARAKKKEDERIAKAKKDKAAREAKAKKDAEAARKAKDPCEWLKRRL